MNIICLLMGLFTLVELNCENLFDCEHDSLKQDQEFLESGYRRWNHYKYWQKLNHIGQDILSCGTQGKLWKLPDLVALCEVENDTVMRDLTERSLLRGAEYEYVMTDSPDERGIDVALLYSPFTFKLLSWGSIRVKPMRGMKPTRDILYARGEVITGDTLHVFVVHAPSRAGSERGTRPYRRLVMRTITERIDSIKRVSSAANILVAGDFNDESGDASLQVLTDYGLKEVSAHVQGRHGAKGSYRYKGRWESVDHIFASQRLAAKLTDCHVGDAPFLMEEDATYGGYHPLRTFYGAKYLNGYSDHLPLIARFNWEEDEKNNDEEGHSR